MKMGNNMEYTLKCIWYQYLNKSKAIASESWSDKCTSCRWLAFWHGQSRLCACHNQTLCAEVHRAHRRYIRWAIEFLFSYKNIETTNFIQDVHFEKDQMVARHADSAILFKNSIIPLFDQGCIFYFSWTKDLLNRLQVLQKSLLKTKI